MSYESITNVVDVHVVTVIVAARILVGEEDEISFVDRFKYFITLLIYESI